MAGDQRDRRPDFSALRFAAMLKAARELRLEQGAINAVALRFDPRRPDIARAAEDLAEALLARRPFELPGAA